MTATSSSRVQSGCFATHWCAEAAAAWAGDVHAIYVRGLPLPMGLPSLTVLS